MSHSQQPVCVEMADRSGALQHIGHQTGISEPPLGVGTRPRRAKRTHCPQPSHVNIGPPQLPTDSELADQATTRPQTPSDLRHRGSRIRYAVQAVEAHAQIELAIIERHLLDTAFDEGDPVTVLGRNPAAGTVQHRRRHVQTHIGDVLIGPQSKHRDSAARRHIEYCCTVRHVADDVHRPIDTLNVGAHDKSAKPASSRFLPHCPVIRRAHGPYEHRTLPNPADIDHSNQPNQAPHSKPSITRPAILMHRPASRCHERVLLIVKWSNHG